MPITTDYDIKQFSGADWCVASSIPLGIYFILIVTYITLKGNTPMLVTAVFIIFSYLIGSISSAVLVCRGLGLGDPRQGGSGNPGATNVLRLGGKKAAVIVLACDLLKGTIPVILAKIFGISAIEIGVVAVAAVLGHMYPVFFKFHGGKGVATALGALLGIYWLVALLVIVTWLIVAKLFKYSSLAALVAITLAPFYAAALLGLNYFYPLCAIALLIIYRHRGNIQRLRAGTEPKIGAKHKHPEFEN
jgi:glycerol-3-phosphate acyltransferase PlsY